LRQIINAYGRFNLDMSLHPAGGVIRPTLTSVFG